MKGKLTNKVAVITGGAGGIGREIASLFSAEGANIVIVDILEDELKATEAALRKKDQTVVAATVDVTAKKEITALVADAIDTFGKIDILVNNAAYIHYAKFLDYPEEEWDKVLNIGLKGYFLCGQAIAREMVKKKNGSIINMASVAGEVGVPLGCAYCSSKGGVISLTRLMAAELAQYNVRVNAIAPGVVDTENVRRVVGEDGMKLREMMIPLGRLAKTGDIARTALFLSSDDADYITGDVLRVDGGIMASAVPVRD